MFVFFSLGLFLNPYEDVNAGSVFKDDDISTGDSFAFTFTNEINVFGHTTNDLVVSLKDVLRLNMLG